MAGIEHGTTALRREIEWILRQIVLSRCLLRCRPGNVEGGNVIDGMRPGVRSKEGKAVAEALSQTGFQSVVAGIRDAGDLTKGTVDAIIGLRQRASGIEAPLIHVARGGNRTRVCHCTARASRVQAGDVDRRIPFDEERKSHTGRAYVADLQEPVRAKRPLDIQIPILRVW